VAKREDPAVDRQQYFPCDLMLDPSRSDATPDQLTPRKHSVLLFGQLTNQTTHFVGCNALSPNLGVKALHLNGGRSALVACNVFSPVLGVNALHPGDGWGVR